MIRTLAITVLCGLAASPAAVATPGPTALGASIDNATPKKADDGDPALVAKAEILLKCRAILRTGKSRRFAPTWS
jgi:hypothetical protein